MAGAVWERTSAYVANSKIYGDAVRETNSGKAGTSASD